MLQNELMKLFSDTSPNRFHSKDTQEIRANVGYNINSHHPYIMSLKRKFHSTKCINVPLALRYNQILHRIVLRLQREGTEKVESQKLSSTIE